jgi:peroxiredoxin
VRADLIPGNQFPDIRLPEHTGRELSLSGIASGMPLILCFLRGWWCPKEQVRIRQLVTLQEELQREYGRIAVVTVDEPYVNGAFRAGVGASFPFLSDERREVAKELELLELTDSKHLPYLPYTFVLDSLLRIRASWCGFWFAENPTPDELRLALRAIVRAEQPTRDPHAVWRDGGSAPVDAGIDGDVIWVHEDDEGREIQRGVHHGDIPEVGEQAGRSIVDRRPWLVHEVERSEGKNGRVLLHMRKGGRPDRSRLVGHHITVPRF